MNECPTNYMLKLGDQIRQARAAMSLPPLNGEEQVIAVKAFAQVLWPEVPLYRLENAFADAIRAKSEPPTVSGSVATFRALAASDVLRHYRETYYSERDENRFRRILEQKICTTCRGKGSIQVYDPVAKVDVVKPCPFCKK